MSQDALFIAFIITALSGMALMAFFIHFFIFTKKRSGNQSSSK